MSTISHGQLAKPRGLSAPPEEVPPIRDRRKHDLRLQLSDTATRMFLERGFDAVRVSDIARACGVSEKTVFNHFRTKESLLLDRTEATIRAIEAGLADDSLGPVEAITAVLNEELRFLTTPHGTTWPATLDGIRRFAELIQSTPSLRAHNRDRLDQLTRAVAAALARRAGAGPPDPGPPGADLPGAGPPRAGPPGAGMRIAAIALAGLVTVFYESFRSHLDCEDPARLRQEVRRDLRRAGEVLRAGL